MYFLTVSQKAVTIQLEKDIGISLSIPEQSLDREITIDLLIHPYFRESAKLPSGYESASPTYCVQPIPRVKFLKDITVRIHHYANLQTEEDCKDMEFVSASLVPEERPKHNMFERITGGKFRPGSDIGEIALRSFSFMEIIRRIRRRGRGSNSIADDNNNITEDNNFDM